MQGPVINPGPRGPCGSLARTTGPLGHERLLPPSSPPHAALAYASLAVGASAARAATSRREAKPRRRVVCAASRGKTSRTGAKRGLHSAGSVLSTGTVTVSDGFELYYEEHGSSKGIPVVFLHGGPGAGSSRRMAQLFDSQKYRILLFDQRGCGKSSKKDSSNAEDQLEGNTTWHLVEDLEVLRAHLKIDRWVVCGGSWGTCLALAYASKHPQNVLGMVLRAAVRLVFASPVFCFGATAL